MNRSMRNAALLALLLAVSGCSSVKDAGKSVGGWFGSGDGTLSTAETKAPANSSGSLLKYAATLRVNKYVDQRKLDNPRQLGISTQRIRGMDQGALLLDQELANVVTAAVKKQFDTEGYQVLEGAGADKAIFEASGVIKELTLNVKYRDEITIGIETTLKDVRTGAVVWSGMVTEKNDRFAGVSGNSKEDVVDYLNKELRVVTGKTVDAISASLMATQPELFNLTPGTKPIAGVTVYVAPTVAKPAAPVVSTVPAPAVMMPNGAVPSAAPVPPPAYVPHASATSGLLLVNTSPARAKVYLDGVYYGMSPLRLEMEPGVHAISVKLEGYKMVTEKVSVRKGDNTEMELTLER
ncbi:MAG: PEGA domain-containing protein [Nitrosomonadales bacterium]|nr:PEGA domain-containing protein [Nitrosomonadales bacterium]